MSPSVTVLLAVHNGGRYLSQAIESVFAQSYGDFELLVVDDASDDDSPEYLASLRDPRVRVVRNERNLGQVPSLNRGLSEARGGYIARIDADDVMLPTRLARQVEILETDTRVGLVGTWMVVVDDRGRRWGTTRGRIENYADFVSALLVNRLPFGHPSIMFRREAVQRLGGYDESLAPSEDKDLYRRLALERYEARVVPDALVRYRRHDAQLSQLQVERQLATDFAGHERFLTELSGSHAARALRLLLAADPAFWDEPTLHDLAGFVESTTERLGLQPGERDAVARTVAAQCAHTLFRAWSTNAPVDSRAAAALVRFARNNGRAGTRAAVALQPVVRGTRPLGAGLRRSRTLARRALRHSERLAPLRARARRSRTLSRLYAALLGFQLVDDGVDGSERVHVPREPRS